LALAVIVAIATAAVQARAADVDRFQVTHARTRLVDGVYLLDARIDFHFSEESRAALDNGVPLTVLIDIDVIRVRDHLWDKEVTRMQARYRIRTHPLSGRYLLANLNSGQQRAYRDYAEMRAALGRISDFPMIDQALVKSDARYRVRLRPRLDIEALPSPLRPLAYLRSLWRSPNKWSEWPLER